MLSGGAEEYATTESWIAAFPGLAIMLMVAGFNSFGDALRDAVDCKAAGSVTAARRCQGSADPE
jgi:ABC-type dipeptide/oligopeptide/nickel transport system permease subunit